MPNGQTVSVTVLNGPRINVAWTPGMNAQEALEAAYIAIGSAQKFTYALQYFGQYGYLVVMINDTFETFVPSAAPNYYWEFFVNGSPAQSGIDGVVVNAGDEVSFEFQPYLASTHANTTVGAKHAIRSKGLPDNPQSNR